MQTVNHQPGKDGFTEEFYEAFFEPLCKVYLVERNNNMIGCSEIQQGTGASLKF